eukprot:3101232-Pyramimonas_sp.AAC.1
MGAWLSNDDQEDRVRLLGLVGEGKACAERKSAIGDREGLRAQGGGGGNARSGLRVLAPDGPGDEASN